MFVVTQSSNRLDHVGIAVHDADSAVGFYRDRFGFEVSHDETLGEIAVRLVYLAAGTTMIQLLQPVGPGAISEYLAENGEGLHHVCFSVDDIRDFLDSNPVERADVFQGGRDRPACFIASRPNNVLIELTEHNPRVLN
ncbi:MAG: VOC family protein [Dehalococcoidia bacterium]